jgi:hypothetical protein
MGRRGARLSRPSPGLVIPAQSRAASRGLHKLARPYVIPIQAYTRLDRSALQEPGSAVISAAGTATIQLGPAGLGARWYPVMAAVGTTVGAADTSTVSVYAGTLGVASAQAAQSYNGGGDTAGFNAVELYPGLYVIAVWAGGTPGSVATLTVYGDQVALV